jgi:MerR family transcriptional regulator, copper efflux regulator
MRIGEVAKAAGLTANTIRFYEQAGLLPAPARTAAHYRDFPPETAVRLRFIREAQAAGLTLADIRGVLAIRDAGHPPCEHLKPLINAHIDHIEGRIRELTAARAVLQSLALRAAATDPDECTESDICSILVTPGEARHRRSRRSGAADQAGSQWTTRARPDAPARRPVRR